MCNNDESKRYLHKLVFSSSSDIAAAASFLLNDKTFLNGDLKFVDEKIQQICDQGEHQMLNDNIGCLTE